MIATTIRRSSSRHIGNHHHRHHHQFLIAFLMLVISSSQIICCNAKDKDKTKETANTPPEVAAIAPSACELCGDDSKGLKCPLNKIDDGITSCVQHALDIWWLDGSSLTCKWEQIRQLNRCCTCTIDEQQQVNLPVPEPWNEYDGKGDEETKCELCWNGNFPGDTAMVITMLDLGYGAAPCDDFYKIGQDGLIPKHLCHTIQYYAYEPCGCDKGPEIISISDTTPQPSNSPTPKPTTEEPTLTPTISPTTPEPTPTPTLTPTGSTPEPTVMTPLPTPTPSYNPTEDPTPRPSSDQPSFPPSFAPTDSPSSHQPSFAPTDSPSSHQPSDIPSDVPSDLPSPKPTDDPTLGPTIPSSMPTSSTDDDDDDDDPSDDDGKKPALQYRVARPQYSDGKESIAKLARGNQYGGWGGKHRLRGL